MRLLDITMIGIGAMIGAGIFVLSGIAAGYAGPACIIAFILNGIINIITGMTYAELGSAYPEAGGGYLWVRKGLPPPFGFVSGWISWFGHTVACALYAVGFGTYLAWLISEYGLNPLPDGAFLSLDKTLAVIISVLLLYVNYRGTAATGRSEVFFTMSKLLILFIFIGLGALAMLQNPRAMDNLLGDFFPGGGGGILFAMSLTLIAFQGYEVIAQTGEEVKDPKKNIPRAIFISLIVVTIIYVFIIIVLFGIVTTDIMRDANANSPVEYLGRAGESGELALVEISQAAMGPIGVGLILLGGFLSTLSALNATIFSSSRVSFAMGRDGTLPRALGRLNRNTRTPANAILVSGSILILLVIVFPIKTIAGAADVMFLVLFSITNAAGISLRYRMPNLDRGFKVPLFPLLPILGVVLNIALIYPLYLIEPLAVYLGIIWILIGAYVHYFTGAKEEILEKPLAIREMPTSADTEKPSRYNVLVPVGFLEREALVDLGGVIAKSKDGTLSLLNIVEVPASTAISAVGFSEVKEPILNMEKLEAHGRKYDIPVDARLLISRDVAGTIVDAAIGRGSNLIILGWQGSTSRGVIMGTNIDRVVAEAPCDVLVYKWEVWRDKMRETAEQYGQGWYIANMLGLATPDAFEMTIPIGKGLNAEVVADLATIIAVKQKANITLLVISKKGERSKEDRSKTEGLVRYFKGQNLPVTVRRVVHEDMVHGLMQETKKTDLLLLGPSGKDDRGRSLFGDLTDRIAGAVDCPTVILKKIGPMAVPPGSTETKGDGTHGTSPGGGPDGKTVGQPIDGADQEPE